MTSLWVFRRLAEKFKEPGLRINIAPIHVFGRNGLPGYSLRTAENGRIRTQELHGRACEEGSVDMMHEFWELVNDREPPDIKPSCVVWYEDGEREEMDTHLVRRLALEGSLLWEEEVIAIQGYVVPQRVEAGFYRANEDALFGSCGNIRDAAAEVGLNMLTKALAKRVMGVHAVEADEAEATWRTLDFLHAVYVVDRNGTLWFSHAADLRVRPCEDNMKDNKIERQVVTKPQLVAFGSDKLLHEATNSGPSVEKCLSHFDPLHQRFVGVDTPKMGLMEFGVGVTSGVAGALIQEFGAKNAGSLAADGLAFSTRHEPKGGQFRLPSAVRPMQSSLSCRDFAAVPTMADERFASPKRAGQDITPSDLARVRRPRGKDIPPKSCWGELPCWARQASRVTLQELMIQHSRYRQKARTDAMVLGNPLKPDIEPKEKNDGSLRPRSAQNRAPSNCPNPARPVNNRQDMAKEDFKVHVGGGNMMSYRWVTRAVAEPNYDGSVLAAMEALYTSQRAMGMQAAQQEPFFLIVMPGLFMTLDSMERCLGGMLEHNNRGKLLLVGSLGLPGTKWADGEVLDAKKQAHGLSILLAQLMERGELRVDPRSCVVLAGFGAGANAVLQFAGTFLLDNSFAALRDATRFLAVINPFPVSQSSKCDIQHIKSQLQVLKRTLERGTHQEQLQSVVAAMFSAEYVEKSGHESVLKAFWLTRQGLELPEVKRPKSGPNVSGGLRHDQHHGKRSTEGKVGVLECIDGLLHGATLGTWGGTIDVPVLLLTSTRDHLGSSTQIKLGSLLGAQDVDSLSKLVSGNKTCRIMVFPVPAGRELLQEAPVRTLQILLGALHAAQAQPIATRLQKKTSEEDILDLIDVCDVRARSPSIASKMSALSEWVGPDQAKSLNAFAHHGGVETIRREVTEKAPAPSCQRAHDRGCPKGRRARDFDTRTERAADRKAKNERLRRQQELERLERAKKKADDVLKQQEEGNCMQIEDGRSAEVDRHTRSLKAWASRIAGAKERACELMSSRDRSDQKVIEDQLFRDRAEQHIQRNNMFRERKMALLEQDREEDGETGVASNHIQDGRHDEIDFARDLCRNVVDQLSSLRKRMVTAMRVELRHREQLETFQSQYSKLETGLREAERLQRAYARRGFVTSVPGDASAQEVKDIDASVIRQHILLGTYQSVSRQRREVWELAVLHVQKLKIMIRATETELRKTLDGIRAHIAALRSEGRKKRASNESLAKLRATVESKTKEMKSQADLLTHEQSILGSHSGSYFDSNIWHEGVPQRMSKSLFARDLQVKLESLKSRIGSNMQRLGAIDATLSRDIKEGRKVEANISKLGQIVRLSEDIIDPMAQKTVVQQLRAILDAEQDFKSDSASVLGQSREKNIAQTIRNKASHQRRPEEKQWVGMDILINRALYSALSAVEHEELQLNDEYKTGFTSEDVARLLRLPLEIQLALPHLRSAAEIAAHKLLMAYTLEHGEEEFVRADEQSQDHIFFAPAARASPGRPTTCTADALATDSSHEVGGCLAHNHRKDHRGAIGPSQHTSCLERIHGVSTGESLHATPRGSTDSISLVNTMSEVASKHLDENDGEVAVRVGGQEIYRSESTPIRTQESRVHRFEIVNTPPTYFIDLKVTITFTGCTDSRGFNQGRISAVLRRPVCTAGLVASERECIGYAPHVRQRVNTGDQFYQAPGTIFIQHCPRRVPLAFGTYEVEVTALGPTEYSLVVLAGQCELCASLVDKRLEGARQLKVRLKHLEDEQRDTWEGVRLRERQYHVCNTLIEEARSECARCHKAIDELCEKLRPRDVGAIVGTLAIPSLADFVEPNKTPSRDSGTRSSSLMSESYFKRSPSSTTANSSSELSVAEQVQTWKEVAAIETEHMHWAYLLTTRCQEKSSVKKALQCLMKLRRDGGAEKGRLERKLEQMSAEIPIVVNALHGSNAAAEISMELNSSYLNGNNGCPSSTRGGYSQEIKLAVETPAGKTRQAFRTGGFGVLTSEQQRWILKDQSMRPDQYEGLKQQHEEGCFAPERRIRKRIRQKHPTLDQYRFGQEELRRTLAEPSEDLNRKMYVRKLLHKFHDDHRLVDTDIPTACAETHISSLAKRTRGKHHHHRTTIEKEWISIDKILNPTMWKRAKGDMPGAHSDERPSETSNQDIHEEQMWACPFNRDDLLRIWAQNDGGSLATEDEKRAFKLLATYNGSNPGVPKTIDSGRKAVHLGESTGGLDGEVDQRLRCLQRELDRVAHCSKPKITSSVLHAVPQRYITSTLRLHLEAEIDRLLREQVQQRERKSAYLIEDLSSSEEDEKALGLGEKRENRRRRRQKHRVGRGDINIFDARKRMVLESSKTPLEIEHFQRIANLGPGGCPACMSNPCKRSPVVNPEEAKLRLEQIADELYFARVSTEDTIESTLPLSVKTGESTLFRRIDFIEELRSEQRFMRSMVKLHYIDEEFHDANRTSKQHMECVALHGYRTMLWTKDARVALEREHSRLVARVVAVEIAHDILEWMLEGWHFGERPTRRAPVSHDTSLQAGASRKTSDETQAGVEATTGEQTFATPPGGGESGWERTSERVVKKGGVHDEEIMFVERTMRFGLFCVAVMYFRARWLLRQQRQHASRFRLGWKIDTNVPVRAKNKPINQAILSSTQAGYQRVKVRKEKEQAEVLADFAGFVAVERRELDASQLIQRVLRGHIGRKAAHRWRQKRGEYNATNSLMVSAAVSVQRVLRGSWGRKRAKTIRAGIAVWLARLVDDEARGFEADVLSTNKLEALKRGIEELVVDDTDSDT